tara:strand:+ start:159 stop:1514 length:1356 start_codon:yes stop_codon:yes gene_type:complete
MAGLTKIQSGGIGDDIDFDGEDTLVLDSTNNRVGIGTSSPQQNLQINDSVTPTIRFSRDSSYYWDIGHTSSDFQFNSETGGTIMHLNFNGNVGIGTTNPLSLLHLASNAPYITFEDKDNNQDWQLQATAWFALRDQTNNAERLRIDSSGNVGIGTSSPSAALHIQGNSTSGYAILAPAANDKWLTLAGSFGDPVIAWNSSNSLRFGTSTSNTLGGFTERMRFDSSGRLGIGTSSPDQLFHISSSTNTRAKIATTSTASFGQLYMGDEDKFLIGYGSTHPNSPDELALRNNTGAIFFATGTSSSQERARIDSSGNVGIGTTAATAKLQVNGDLGITGTKFACVEHGRGANGSFTSCVFDYAVSGSPATVMFETQVYGYNNDYVDNLIGAYGGSAQTIRNNTSSGMSVALSFPGGGVTHRITISGSITHPVAKVKATSGGLSSAIDLLSITWS